MTFIKSLIYKLLNKQISNIYKKRFDTYNNTPKGVFWNSKLSQDLRLNIILDKILNISKNNGFSLADIGCGYGRLYEIIKERNLDQKIQYYGFDINYNLITNDVSFDNIKIDKNSNEEVERFINRFNSKTKREFNKITFKNFINRFFLAYSG